jgi:hypothetical protein
MGQEALLLIHPTFGTLGAMAALWVLVEAVRFDQTGLWRMKIASLVAAGFLIVAWLGGGLWDNAYFDADRTYLEKGSWAFFGNTGMEMKEHLFTIIVVLALYLPIVVFRGNLAAERGNRVVLGVAATFVVLGGLAMEAAGAVLAISIKVGLLQTGGT